MATAEWTETERNLLASLMDKLAALNIDLKPLCNPDSLSALKGAPHEAISDACTILHSAIDDLRAVIGHLDGMASVSRPDSVEKLTN